MGRTLFLSLGLFLLAGCASTHNSVTTTEAMYLSPSIEPVNKKVYAANDFLDDKFLAPASRVYTRITPHFLRTGISNTFANLKYMNVILNNFLQGNIDAGLSDITRMLFNSTIGIGGFFDVASGMNLPKHDEDFGQTLGVWGLGAGAYVNMPLLGPYNVRRLPDIITSALTNPMSYVSAGATIWLPMLGIDILSARSNPNLQKIIEMRDKIAIDPYIFTYQAYRQKRAMLVRDGMGSDADTFFQAADDDLFSDEE